ncbi:ABC1 kinase family protein [Planctomycetaceae bacterium SH139]
MKISSIPQLYRNLRRWQEILAVLQRYGLADWLSHFPRLPFREYLKDRDGQPLASQSREVRIRKALCELGPTFIKLGQMLASRSDLVGLPLAEELKHLRANVPPDPPGTVLKILQHELGDLAATELADFCSTPLAAASIGQVHTAKLRDGTEVVLKIQRDQIESTVHQDLDVLAGLAQLAERVPGLAAWGPVEMVNQLSPMLRRELDFQREQRHLSQFADFFAADPRVQIPRPIEFLCTRRVLTMTRFHGQSLDQWIAVSEPPSPLSRVSNHGPAAGNGSAAGDGTPAAADAVLTLPNQHLELGEQITRCYMRMLFELGMFHADPHPGNLMLLADGRLGILDFGMVGRIDDRLRDAIEQILIAIAAADHRSLVRLLKRMGNAPATLDEAAFSIDVSEYIANYGRQELARFDMTSALNDLSSILHRHGIKLPHQSALLLKMLISLEGTLRGLQADFDSLAVIRQFVRQAMWRRLHPKRRLLQAKRIYLEAEHFLEEAPDHVLQLLDLARKGELRVHLEHQRLSPSVNRLVLGLISSALFLGSSLLLSQEVPPLLFPESTFLGLTRISIFGLAGCLLSLLEMLRLMWAIRQSGALTRGEDKSL